jgi:hypothetical protein
MMSLGEQFGAMMDARSALLVERAGFPIAEEITEKMKELSQGGDGMGEYFPGYKKKYAKVKENAGYATEVVTLRFKNKRIERTTQPTEVMGGAEIGFVEGGEIFKFHQTGKARGGRTRTIFPRKWKDVPPDIYERFKQLIVGVLSGKP